MTVNLWEGLVALMGENTRGLEGWDEAWAEVGSEEWLAAKRLLELSSLQYEAAHWIRNSRHDRAGGILDWIADVDAEGRGWSSTEHRLFRVVAALVDPWPERPDGPVGPYEATRGDGTVHRLVPLVHVFDSMGSWEHEFWQVMVQWGTGGNNRDYPGRLRVVE